LAKLGLGQPNSLVASLPCHGREGRGSITDKPEFRSRDFKGKNWGLEWEGEAG
jgi:hypothetical protein